MIELCGQLFPRTVHPVAFILEGRPVCLVTIPNYVFGEIDNQNQHIYGVFENNVMLIMM